MPLYPLALFAGLLPLLTIHITYLLAAAAGQVDWCVPYIHSCTSISATGRLPPSYFVFKGLMIPAAVVLMIYWLLNARWLGELGSERRRAQQALIVLGIVAGVGLVAHSVFLGAIGPEYRSIRRSGVLLFFGFTLLAQLLITWLLQTLPQKRFHFPRHLTVLIALMWLDVLLGLGNVVIGYLDPLLYDEINDAMAWNFILLVCLHVLITADLWRRSGWGMELRNLRHENTSEPNISNHRPRP